MNKVHQLTLSSRTAGAAIAALAIAGCGGNAASPPGAVTVVSPSKSTLQLAVGTANLFGTSTGLNVVTTLRTAAGKSVLVNTPKLTGPFVLPSTAGTPDANGATIATGPAPSEISAGGLISGSPQIEPGSTPATTTLGEDGGVFAGGLQPANANNLGGVESGGNINDPYPQPNYNNADANSFEPIGGPPAFDPNGDGEGTRDGTFPSSVLGVNEGINAFEGVTTEPGTYDESVLIPSNGTVQTTVTATPYTLGPPTLLPIPTAPTYVPDGNGGGTFAVTLPAGVTDALLNIEDLGPDYFADAAAMTTQPINCYTNGSYPAYYTIHVTASGSYTLPDSDGVGSPKVHNPTICTAAQNTAANGGTATDGDSYIVQLVGADYPLYASNVLFTLTTAAPNIFGAGSDDITISPIVTSPDGDTGTAKSRLPQLKKRMFKNVKAIF